jgi:lipopolysaccharide assembly outer membrane protein LptD (OstA)
MASRALHCGLARAALAIMLPIAANVASADPIDASTGADATASMEMLADEFTEMTADGQMILKGHVEVHYQRYALKADQLIYSWARNELQAVGNVYILEPDGTEIPAGRITLNDAFRDAFLRSFPDISRKTR